MGRTFEVLTRGRARKLAGVEPVAAIPFPSADLEPPATVSLVPAAADDLPNDDNALPYIEVGGPRPSVPASPQLLAPKPLPPSPVGDLTFQLLPAPRQHRWWPITSGPISSLIISQRTRPDGNTAD